MKEIAFTELNIQPNIKVKNITCGTNELQVCQYLPILEKGRMVEFIANGAINQDMGTFDPIRTEVNFAIGLCRWYAGITFTEKDMENVATIYDTLETNGYIDSIIAAIPEDEIGFLKELVTKTLHEIASYNTSAAGIIQSMNNNATGLSVQIEDILEQIKNGEGLEQLSVIKDVVGKD